MTPRVSGYRREPDPPARRMAFQLFAIRILDTLGSSDFPDLEHHNTIRKRGNPRVSKRTVYCRRSTSYLSNEFTPHQPICRLEPDFEWAHLRRHASTRLVSMPTNPPPIGILFGFAVRISRAEARGGMYNVHWKCACPTHSLLAGSSCCAVVS